MEESYAAVQAWYRSTRAVQQYMAVAAVRTADAVWLMMLRIDVAMSRAVKTARISHCPITYPPLPAAVTAGQYMQYICFSWHRPRRQYMQPHHGVIWTTKGQRVHTALFMQECHFVLEGQPSTQQTFSV